MSSGLCKTAQVIAGAVIVLASASAAAQSRSYEVTFEAGIAATDNLGRTADTPANPAEDETIYTAGMNFVFVNESRRWDADFAGAVERNIYDNRIYDDETLSTVNGSASIFLIDERLDWDFSVNHGQQLVNPFQPANPENREDVTILSTGPRFSIPLGTRTYITGNGAYTDISYDERPFDNDRVSGGLGILRDISQTTSVSLNADAARIEYDESTFSPPIDRQDAYIGVETENARNRLSAKLGWNSIERAGTEGDGFLLNIDWSREISARSRLSVNLGSEYSTDGDIFRYNQQLENERRDLTQDVQNVDDPFQHDYARLAYTYSMPRTRFSASIRYDTEEYETASLLDRDISSIDLSIRREFSPQLTGSTFARFGNREYDSLDRDDDDITLGGTLRWKFTEKLSADLRVEWYDRSANNSQDDYDETRGTLIFRYTPLQQR